MSDSDVNQAENMDDSGYVSWRKDRIEELYDRFSLLTIAEAAELVELNKAIQEACDE